MFILFSLHEIKIFNKNYTLEKPFFTYTKERAIYIHHFSEDQHFNDFFRLVLNTPPVVLATFFFSISNLEGKQGHPLYF